MRSISERDQVERKIRSIEDATDRYIQSVDNSLAILGGHIGHLCDGRETTGGKYLKNFPPGKCIEFEGRIGKEIDEWRSCTRNMKTALVQEHSLEINDWMQEEFEFRERALKRIHALDQEVRNWFTEAKAFSETHIRDLMQISDRLHKELQNEIAACRFAAQKLSNHSNAENELEYLLTERLEQTINLKTRELETDRIEIAQILVSAYEKAVREFEENFELGTLREVDNYGKENEFKPNFIRIEQSECNYLEPLQLPSPVMRFEDESCDNGFDNTKESFCSRKMDFETTSKSQNDDYRKESGLFFARPNESFAEGYLPEKLRSSSSRTSPLLLVETTSRSPALSSSKEPRANEPSFYARKLYDSTVLRTNDGGFYARKLERMLESTGCFDTPPQPPVEAPQEELQRSRFPNFSAEFNSLAPNDQAKSLRQSSELSGRKGREGDVDLREDALRRSSSLRRKTAWKQMAKRSLNSETLSYDFPSEHGQPPKAQPRRVRLHQPERFS